MGSVFCWVPGWALPAGATFMTSGTVKLAGTSEAFVGMVTFVAAGTLHITEMLGTVEPFADTGTGTSVVDEAFVGLGTAEEVGRLVPLEAFTGMEVVGVAEPFTGVRAAVVEETFVVLGEVKEEVRIVPFEAEAFRGMEAFGTAEAFTDVGAAVEAFTDMGADAETFEAAGTVAPKGVLVAVKVALGLGLVGSVDPFAATGTLAGTEALVV